MTRHCQCSRTTWLLAAVGLALLAFLPAPVRATLPGPLPSQGPAPLLYVRFVGAPGLHITFYPGDMPCREYEAPVVAGLRPGYIYRVKVWGLPGHPDQAFYPTLEVRGTLQMPPGHCAADYPTPVVFSGEDIERVRSGAFLHKVLYLEDPERAIPEATRPDQPIELEVPAKTDLLYEARQRGRPVLVLRWGERELSPDELAHQAIPGTVLIPGAKVLPMPAVPPCIPWACFPIYDPVLGPKPPVGECLHDGGDVGRPAGFDRDGRLLGLDPSDSMAEYVDSRGKRRLAISNRVCICVPRFAVLRIETIPAGYDFVLAPARRESTLPGILLQAKVPPRLVQQNEQLQLAAGKSRVTESESRLGTVPVEQFIGAPTVVGEVQGQAVIGTCVKHKEAPDVLVLCKTADKHCAQVGEIITFSLRYANHGGQAITGVVVSDSLTGRLEYVPGSAQADRDTVFTTQENEAGSLILRWEVGGLLLPGQAGVVSFQAKVR